MDKPPISLDGKPLSNEQWNELQEQVAARQFELSARSWKRWLANSERLWYAADVLWERYQAAWDEENKIIAEEIVEVQGHLGSHEARLFLEKLEKNRTQPPSPSSSRALTAEESARWSEIALGQTATMLFGLAFESLFKAILVRKAPDKSITSPETKAKRRFAHRTHDLVTLAGLVGFGIDEEEKRTLKVLTSSIEWAGRYPNAMTPREMHMDAMGTISHELMLAMGKRAYEFCAKV